MLRSMILVEFAPIQPNSAAFWTVVDLDALTVAHHKIGPAGRAKKPMTFGITACVCYVYHFSLLSIIRPETQTSSARTSLMYDLCRLEVQGFGQFIFWTRLLLGPDNHRDGYEFRALGCAQLVDSCDLVRNPWLPSSHAK